MARRRRRHDPRGAPHRQRVARPRAHRLRAQRLLRADARASRPSTCTRRDALDDAWEARVRRRRALYDAVGRARALPRGIARSRRVALLPGPRLHVPGPPEQRAAHARAARLGPRARRLRLDRRVARSRCSGSSPAPTTTPRRSRCSRWCSGCSRPATSSARPRASSSTTAATSRRDADRMAVRLADAMYRGREARLAPRRHRARSTRPTSSPPTGSRTPTGRSTRCAPTRAPATLGGRDRGGFGPRGNRAASRRSSTRTGTRVAEAEEHEYDSYGAEPA